MTTCNFQIVNRPPYMTRRHFVMLAEELAHDKLYYTNPLSYHEKLNRMITYCQASNEKFNIKSFKAKIDSTYKGLVKNLEKNVGSTT